MDIKNMTLDELKKLKDAVIKEIASREENTSALVVYTHQCSDATNYHKNKNKHWSKLVQHVDTTKCSGYAFVGDFLVFEREHMVPKNSIVVEACGDTICAYLIDGHNNSLIAESDRKSMSKFIQLLAHQINT